MKEACVSFDTANLLKEKGFDWPTIEYYSSGGGIYRFSEGIAGICGILSYPRPTQQMACRWLREEKNIYVTAVPDIGNSLRFYPAIYVIKGEIPEEYWFEHINSVVEELNKSYGEPQQTIDAALEYVLKNLI